MAHFTIVSLKKIQPPSAISVIIPARDENDGINFVLSLIDPELLIPIQIIVVVNASASDPINIKISNERLSEKLIEIKSTIQSNYTLEVILENNLNDKEAGVGLARKIGMDMAAYNHEKNNEIGILVCFDADCNAPPGYLKSIFTQFIEQKIELASIRYQHPITENNHPIVAYELFLRYYSEALKKAGYPFWYQTVGSSMAVLSNHYLKHGGMNKRKAGEDFYFMHKLMPVCKTDQINTTCNWLSARTSLRVPFGTGKAMIDANTAAIKNYYSYQPIIFEQLKIFIDYFKSLGSLEEIENWKNALLNNAVAIHFDCFFYWEEITKIKNNCKSMEQFKPRFFQFFNGFKVLKYVHWARDTYYTNVLLNDAVIEFLELDDSPYSNLELLLMFRNLEVTEIH